MCVLLQNKRTGEKTIKYVKHSYPLLLHYRKENDGLPYPRGIFDEIDEYDSFDALAYRLHDWVHYRRTQGFSTALVVCSRKRTAEMIYKFLLNLKPVQDDQKEPLELPFTSRITRDQVFSDEVMRAIEIAVDRDVVTITSPVVGPGVSNTTKNAYDGVFLFADIAAGCPTIPDIVQLAARFRSITDRRLMYALRSISSNNEYKQMKRLDEALRVNVQNFKSLYRSLLKGYHEEMIDHLRVCADQTYARVVMKRALVVAFSIYNKHNHRPGGYYKKPQHHYHIDAAKISISEHTRTVRYRCRKRNAATALEMKENTKCDDSRPCVIPKKRQKLE